jgi:uncharacterized RDD family membrane protein YckC
MEPELVPALAGSFDDPPWRREVARKLEAYRRRHHDSADGDFQSALPFIELPHEPAPPIQRLSVERMPLPHAARPKRGNLTERIEIAVEQSSLSFTLPEERLHPETRLAPAATISERLSAGLTDFFFLAVVYGGFLFFFRAVGGHLNLTKLDAGIFGASFLLLYVSYFSLFTVFGGATPGMLLSGLMVVQIDGDIAETSPLVWRSIGYLLSGGTLFLGFFWALWDEDGLTWHDRISQTYITKALIAEEGVAASPASGEHSFAAK